MRAHLKGTSTLEYGVLIGLLAIVAIGTIVAFGKTQEEIFEDLAQAMEGAALIDGQYINGGYWFDGQVNMASADCYIGTDGDDTLLYPQSSIYLCFTGTTGNDLTYGNERDNTFSDNTGNDTFHGMAGNDIMNGWKGNDTFYGGDGDDTISDGRGNNISYGGNGNDTINSNGTIFGEAGNDVINVGFWRVIIDGGDGDDTNTGSSAKYNGHEITGGPGADVFEWTNPEFNQISIKL